MFELATASYIILLPDPSYTRLGRNMKVIKRPRQASGSCASSRTRTIVRPERSREVNAESPHSSICEL